MAHTVDDRRPGLRSTLSAVLAIALLVPLGILFSQVWRSTDDDIAALQRERRGVEYLARLSELLSATSQAQAAALQGQAPPDTVGQAVARTEEIDQRLGAELATRERWSALRAKIEKLPRATNGQELATYQAHNDASQLLLALYRTVRNESGLARDQQTDTFHLQQALGEDLPGAVVQASRLADLIALAPKAPAAQRGQLGFGLGVARQEAAAAVEEMTDGLQAAADDTTSGTLSSGVLGGLDRFRLSVDGLVQGATTAINAATAPGGDPPGADDAAAGLAQLATIRAGMQTAAGDLATAMLRETDAVLADRIADARARQRSALIVAVAGALIALLAVLVPVVGRRRGRRGQQQPAVGGSPPGGPPVAPGRPGPQEPSGAARRPSPEEPAGAARRFGEDATAQWERDDVLR